MSGSEHGWKSGGWDSSSGSQWRSWWATPSDWEHEVAVQLAAPGCYGSGAAPEPWGLANGCASPAASRGLATGPCSAAGTAHLAGEPTAARTGVEKAAKAGSCRRLSRVAMQGQDPMQTRIDRNFRRLLQEQEGGVVEILAICDTVGTQLRAANAAAALQAAARAEGGPEVLAADPRLGRVLGSLMSFFSPDAGAASKELAIVAWSLARLHCSSELALVGPAVLKAIHHFTMQELTSVSWAFAKVAVCYSQLWEAISSEVAGRLPEATARELAGVLWSFAKVPQVDEHLCNRICGMAAVRIQEFASMDVINTLWACSQLPCQNSTFSEAILQDVNSRIGGTPSELASIAWSMAKSLLQDAPTMEAIAAQAMPQLPAFAPADLAFIAWSCAKLRCQEWPLLHATASHAAATVTEHNPQTLANLVWAMARIPVSHCPFLASIAAEAWARLQEYQTQEIVMTAWAFATHGVAYVPLRSAMSAILPARIGEFAAQEIANLCWAFAQLHLVDEELADVVARASASRLPAATAKDVAITAWALATLQLGGGLQFWVDHAGLLNDLSARAIDTSRHMSPQELSQVAWAFAKMFLWSKGLTDAVASAALVKLVDCEPVHLRNFAWSYATMLVRYMPLLAAPSQHIQLQVHAYREQQHVANLAWAFAKLHCADAPLLDSLCAVACDLILEFGVQSLSNMSWVLARCCLADAPLVSLISNAVVWRLGEFSDFELGSVAWAMASLVHQDVQLMQAIRLRVLEGAVVTGGDGIVAESAGTHALLWAFWKMERNDIAHEIYEAWFSRGQVPDISEIGFIAMHCAWRKDHAQDVRVALQMMQSMPVRLMRIALWKVAMLSDFHRPPEAPEMPRLNVLGLSEQECRRYQKLARFVQYLELTQLGCSPKEVVDAIELFPKAVGRYLKVAGGDKAVALWEELRRRPLKAHEVLLEVGSLVGYSAIRFGAFCSHTWAEAPAHSTGTAVATLEVDACHAAIARHVINLAGLAGYVEVWSGQARDLLPRMVEEFGQASVGFVFLDHNCTAFHEDLRQLEGMDALAAGGVLVANRCLGAPFYLWHALHSSAYETTVWSMLEFAQCDLEDWLVVCRGRGKTPKEAPTCPPEIHKLLAQLAWETDNCMRSSTEGGNVHVDDRVAFAQYAIRFLAKVGIKGLQWPGPQLECFAPPDMPMDSKRLAERYAAFEAQVEVEDWP